MWNQQSPFPRLSSRYTSLSLSRSRKGRPWNEMIFAGEMATEMIFAGSCLQGTSHPLLCSIPALWPFLFRGNPFPAATAFISSVLPPSFPITPCCDLLHSSSHNFIRPDHGPRGTVWQMYPSANFKLVPASPNDGGRVRGGDRVSGSGLKPYCYT